MPSIVCIVGNRRPNSFTARCLSIISAALRAAGADVQTFDGSKMELSYPHESPTPDALALKTAVLAADAVVLATPEYHGTFSAQAKLCIESLGFPSALQHKPVALLGVAGGSIGAIKAIEHLRGSCSHLGAVVIPGSVSIANVRKSFDDNGVCIDPKTEAALHRLAKSTLNFVDHYRFRGEE